MEWAASKKEAPWLSRSKQRTEKAPPSCCPHYGAWQVSKVSEVGKEVAGLVREKQASFPRRVCQRRPREHVRRQEPGCPILGWATQDEGDCLPSFTPPSPQPLISQQDPEAPLQRQEQQAGSCELWVGADGQGRAPPRQRMRQEGDLTWHRRWHGAQGTRKPFSLVLPAGLLVPKAASPWRFFSLGPSSPLGTDPSLP